MPQRRYYMSLHAPGAVFDAGTEAPSVGSVVVWTDGRPEMRTLIHALRQVCREMEQLLDEEERPAG